jgi:hypothetical protein
MVASSARFCESEGAAMAELTFSRWMTRAVSGSSFSPSKRRESLIAWFM